MGWERGTGNLGSGSRAQKPGYSSRWPPELGPGVLRISGGAGPAIPGFNRISGSARAVARGFPDPSAKYPGRPRQSLGPEISSVGPGDWRMGEEIPGPRLGRPGNPVEARDCRTRPPVFRPAPPILGPGNSRDLNGLSAWIPARPAAPGFMPRFPSLRAGEPGDFQPRPPILGTGPKNFRAPDIPWGPNISGPGALSVRFPRCAAMIHAESLFKS